MIYSMNQYVTTTGANTIWFPTQWQWQSAGISGGAMSPNMVREAEGLEPVTELSRLRDRVDEIAALGRKALAA